MTQYTLGGVHKLNYFRLGQSILELHFMRKVVFFPYVPCSAFRKTPYEPLCPDSVCYIQHKIRAMILFEDHLDSQLFGDIPRPFDKHTLRLYKLNFTNH